MSVWVGTVFKQFQINVNEIESISILKDASTTAIYGIKGANGVLVVKTRRGEEGKPSLVRASLTNRAVLYESKKLGLRTGI